MKGQVLILVIMMTTAILSAQVIHVPGDQPTIQAGIDVAVDGDTVLVAENTYYENVRFMGKAITLGSEYILDGDTNHINLTIINGSQSLDPDTSATVMFINDEDTTSILNGFTITGGSGVFNQTWGFQGGGGIYTSNAGAKIINNKIKNNHVESKDLSNAGGAGIQFLFGEDVHWAVVDNNTISHNTSTSIAYSAFGGGIWISMNGIIRNNIIEHNACINESQVADGGGIEVEAMPGVDSVEVTINNNIIRNNSVNGTTEAVGAGLMGWNSGCIVTNNIFTYNTATSTDHSSGGGLYINIASSKTIVSNNVFHYNSCEANYAWGGGARIRLAEHPLITNNDFSNNTLTGHDMAFGGGLVINKPVGNATVTGNTIEDNSLYGEYGYGGGCVLYMTDTVPLLFNKNIIKNHDTDYGGAMYLRNTYNTTFSNNLFMGNTATDYGGAIFFWNYTDKADGSTTDCRQGLIQGSGKQILKGTFHPFLANNDFIGNSAGNGGAIYSNHEVNMPIFLNCIFWENEAAAFNDIYNAVFNPPFYLTSCDVDPLEIRGNYEGHGNFLSDPLFIDDSCHLNCGAPSPCINAGEEFVEVDGQTYYAPLTDIDGVERPLDDLFDVGADEEALCVFISEQDAGQSPLNLIIAPNPSSGAAHLRYSILDPSASLRTGTRYLILEIYSTDGVKVKTLKQGVIQCGEQEQTFDMSDLPNGMYFIRLQAGEQVETTKLILLK